MSDKPKSLADMMEADASPEAATSVAQANTEKMSQLAMLITEHEELEARIDKGEKYLKELKAKLLKINQTDIPELFVEMGGIASIKMEDGADVSIKKEISVSVKKGKDTECFEFLEANDYAGVVKSTFTMVFGKDEDEKIKQAREVLLKHFEDVAEKRAVNAATLKATIKKLVAAGKEIPACFNFFPYSKTTIKRGK